ncbi:Glyoxalase/Bleomycin resistance protein/Dihydroxybiphenyl dioxygenase [Leucosporidium creatinivorum]|uniref:Glyoxalase/Bleomycin resistance protein/Dihydroxybiphenyl dioxygenase n=1 Tax=Leucosporidium creatinivorum TaxID=106004 RepID=A0A1Y2FWU1_9BASI|nr:Glyoxalase/Bleomycin resistance protein/Dihydroxybiphenyl dioxygenase [Leucosporidium creatinivorum]
MPLITSCDHTGVTVVDLERSLRFWVDVVGFKLVERLNPKGQTASNIVGVEGAEILIAKVEAPGGRHVIELLQYIGPSTRSHLRPRPCDVGSLHVALTTDDLDEALAAMLDAGCEMKGEPVEWNGQKLVYVHDFDGVAIELMQKPSRFA